MNPKSTRDLLFGCAALNLLWAIVLGVYAVKLEGPAAAGLGMLVLGFGGGSVLSGYRARRLGR